MIKRRSLRGIVAVGNWSSSQALRKSFNSFAASNPPRRKRAVSSRWAFVVFWEHVGPRKTWLGSKKKVAVFLPRIQLPNGLWVRFTKENKFMLRVVSMQGENVLPFMLHAWWKGETGQNLVALAFKKFVIKPCFEGSQSGHVAAEHVQSTWENPWSDIQERLGFLPHFLLHPQTCSAFRPGKVTIMHNSSIPATSTTKQACSHRKHTKHCIRTSRYATPKNCSYPLVN